MRLLHLIIAISIPAAVLAPVAGSAASVTEGRKAWLRLNCYGCHGDNGGGGMGPNIRHEADDVAEAMRYGEREGGMRSYYGVPGVKATDPADIAAYLQSVGTAAEPKWHDWWRR